MNYADINTKAGKMAFIKAKVAVSQAWAIRGLLCIYANQTADEKACGQTHNLNGIGFSGCDAEILSSFAEQVIKGRNLSQKQMAIVFKKMPRYAGQLMRAAEAKAEAA